jgi:L-2-hydroxyglutarate oxidase LhgO
MDSDPSRDRIDAVVVGAGVVGLAVARELCLRGIETLVLERHARIGEETSSRNSGVIHSGIYYPSGSLKARLCVDGRERLYAYARARGIAHRRTGKLLVAQGDQLTTLQALHRQGLANGVTDLEWLDSSEVRSLEPQVRCEAALLSPSTGILDVHELMTALAGDLEAHSGRIATHVDVTRIERDGEAFVVVATCDGEETCIETPRLVLSAGLDAVALARRVAGYPPQFLPTPYFAKGSYFACSQRPFSRLVYPMPNQAGLGIHATLDLAGCVRFGPDVEWVDGAGYDVDPGRATAFYAAVREYWPGLRDGALAPALAGVRPKLVGPGQPAADFAIETCARHGLPGLVNLMGIESPGLTSCLSMGTYVADLLEIEMNVLI